MSNNQNALLNYISGVVDFARFGWEANKELISGFEWPLNLAMAN